MMVFLVPDDMPVLSPEELLDEVRLVGVMTAELELVTTLPFDSVTVVTRTVVNGVADVVGSELGASVVAGLEVVALLSPSVGLGDV